MKTITLLIGLILLLAPAASSQASCGKSDYASMLRMISENVAQQKQLREKIAGIKRKIKVTTGDLEKQLLPRELKETSLALVDVQRTGRDLRVLAEAYHGLMAYCPTTAPKTETEQRGVRSLTPAVPTTASTVSIAEKASAR